MLLMFEPFNHCDNTTTLYPIITYTSSGLCTSTFIAARFARSGSGSDAVLALKASIMPGEVSMPTRERTWGASRKESRPVPQPISRTSRSVRGQQRFLYLGRVLGGFFEIYGNGWVGHREWRGEGEEVLFELPS